jgi:O-antigen/teichoic acid export membrane protein
MRFDGPRRGAGGLVSQLSATVGACRVSGSAVAHNLMGGNSYKRLVASALWLLAEAGGSTLVTLAGSLICAVIVGRAATGQAAIVLSIVQLVNFPIAALFADVLVQRPRLKRREANGAFWLLAGIGVAGACSLSTMAPLLAIIYADPGLKPMFMISALATLLTGLSSAQTALLRRARRFRFLAVVGLVSRTVGSVIGVVLAYFALGAWSLVGQYVVSTVLIAIVVFVFGGWKPRLPVQPQACRAFLRFALIETLSQFIEDSRIRVFTPLAALSLSSAAVGDVAFAFRIVKSLGSMIATAAGRLSLVVFARIQHDQIASRIYFLRASQALALMTLPMFAAVGTCAPDLIAAAFGKEWLPAAPQIQLLCIAEGAYFCRGMARYYQTAKARPDISAYTGSVTWFSTVAMLMIYPPQAAWQAMLCWLLPTFIGAILDTILTSKAFGIGIVSQLSALLPGLASAGCSVGAIIFFRTLLTQANLRFLPLVMIEAGIGITIGGLFWWGIFGSRRLLLLRLRIAPDHAER